MSDQTDHLLNFYVKLIIKIFATASKQSQIK